jgi:HK97 family phage major capsid protein
MATLQEMLYEQTRIRNELRRMEDDGSITEETDGHYRDTLIARWETLDADTKPLIERMERIRGITRTAQQPGAQEDGDEGGPRRAPELLMRRDPFEGLDKVKHNLVSPREVVSRSMTAIEMHNRQGLLDADAGEEATRKAQQPGIAKHMLMTGTEDYIASFRKYLEDPTGEGLQRTALSLTLANGGYLLPYVLDPTIVISNSGSANPFRRIARVVQTTSNAWQGVSSAGVTAAWLAEGAVATDNSPTVGQIAIWPQKGAAWVFGSFEFRDDTNFSDQLPRLLSDAKDRLEESAFAVGAPTGTGNSGGSPKGIMAALGTAQVVKAAGTTNGALYGTGGAVDIYTLQATLPARFRLSPSVGWVANITWINKARALDQYGGSSFWANLGDNTPEQLLGQPIYESTSVTSTTATGTGTGNAALVYGAWENYVICDRVGTSMLYEPMVAGTGNYSAQPSGQSGWFYFWRVGADVATTNAFRYLTNGG